MSKKDTATKRVAIVGKAPSQASTPFDDPTLEVWSLSDNYANLPRWDRWFELHDPDWHREQHPPHWDFLRTDHGKPLYLLHPHKDIPHATILPKHEILTRFGDYFTNSVSYMMGVALLEGYSFIGLYGVDMAQTDEYAGQRPSCEYMIGFARGLGCTVEISEDSDLLKCLRLYGYDTHYGAPYRKWRARDRELQQRISQTERQREEATQQTHMFFGGLQALDRLNGINGEAGAQIAQLKLDLNHRMEACASVRDECAKRALHLGGAKDDMQWSRQWF